MTFVHLHTTTTKYGALASAFPFPCLRISDLTARRRQLMLKPRRRTIIDSASATCATARKHSADCTTRCALPPRAVACAMGHGQVCPISEPHAAKRSQACLHSLHACVHILHILHATRSIRYPVPVPVFKVRTCACVPGPPRIPSGPGTAHAPALCASCTSGGSPTKIVRLDRKGGGHVAHKPLQAEKTWSTSALSVSAGTARCYAQERFAAQVIPSPPLVRMGPKCTPAILGCLAVCPSVAVCFKVPPRGQHTVRQSQWPDAFFLNHATFELHPFLPALPSDHSALPSSQCLQANLSPSAPPVACHHPGPHHQLLPTPRLLLAPLSFRSCLSRRLPLTAPTSPRPRPPPRTRPDAVTPCNSPRPPPPRSYLLTTLLTTAAPLHLRLRRRSMPLPRSSQPRQSLCRRRSVPPPAQPPRVRTPAAYRPANRSAATGPCPLQRRLLVSGPPQLTAPPIALPPPVRAPSTAAFSCPALRSLQPRQALCRRGRHVPACGHGGNHGVVLGGGAARWGGSGRGRGRRGVQGVGAGAQPGGRGDLTVGLGAARTAGAVRVQRHGTGGARCVTGGRAATRASGMNAAGAELCASVYQGTAALRAEWAIGCEAGPCLRVRAAWALLVQ